MRPLATNHFSCIAIVQTNCSYGPLAIRNARLLGSLRTASPWREYEDDELWGKKSAGPEHGGTRPGGSLGFGSCGALRDCLEKPQRGSMELRPVRLTFPPRIYFLLALISFSVEGKGSSSSRSRSAPEVPPRRWFECHPCYPILAGGAGASVPMLFLVGCRGVHPPPVPVPCLATSASKASDHCTAEAVRFDPPRLCAPLRFAGG